ncbi:Cilia- and flagella-associated protein 70 [Mytilus coruscus]|uniref:Cilia- and flagella-associated protein 70 n=1 Tax=Mytilus coruscus TaxID=42192 RepID=A0A6J8BPM0_MYTCO|nr:Cilia- and flagella-associated protein 70 [Mytilus coruscus]
MDLESENYCIDILFGEREYEVIIAKLLDLPTVQPFDCNGEQSSLSQRWTKWKKSFEYYMTASGVSKGGQKRALLLHLIGQDAQDIFETLTDTGDSFEDAVVKFDQYFLPKKNQPVERRYVTRLKNLAKTCDFGTMLNDAIRDQVIDMCYSTKLRRRLLREKDLTLEKVQDIARASEAADQHSAQFEEVHVNRVQVKRDFNAARHQRHDYHSKRKDIECHRCGCTGHIARECTVAMDKTCHKCGKMGHFAKKCKSKKSTKEQGKFYIVAKTSESEDIKMADADTTGSRPPEPISITVQRVKNLKGSKGDNVQVMVKMEFGDKTLLTGDPPKVDCSPDAPAEINYTETINVNYDDSNVLDEIAHKPVVLTVIEVLPKEKKQKEEKITPLGQATVDLLPLLKGKTKEVYSLTINPSPGSPLESIPPENPRPTIDVSICVNDHLMDVQEQGIGNLMTVTVETVYAPPESWTMAGTQYAYATALPVPVAADKEVPVVFASGQLKPGTEKEVPNKQKKWASPGSAQGNAVYIPESFIPSDPVEDEDGEFRGKEDREHRHSAETEKLRVTWNTERRCYMDISAEKSFQDKIAKCRYWPVEVMRLPQPAAAKGKKDDEGAISYHGVAFVNLAPLLYPGVKRIRGAYKVHAYTDHAMHEKTKRKTGYGEEAGRIAFNILNRNSASPFPKKPGKDKDDKKDKDVKKGRSGSILHHSSAVPHERQSSMGSSMGSTSRMGHSRTGQSRNGSAMHSNQSSQSKPTVMISSIPEDDDFDNVGPMPSNNYGPLLTPTIPSRLGSSRLAGRRSSLQRSMSTTQQAPPPPSSQTPAEDKDLHSLSNQSERASQTIKSDTGSEMEGQAPVNVEGQQYVEAKSYVMLEICLAHPLIPKRPAEELARRVAEYIPPRPLFPKRTDGAVRSVEDFQNQVASVANLILDEFRDQFGDDFKPDDAETSEAMESRRQKLIYELNSSGKYFAFKEQLKHAVVKIVREKYLRTSTFEDRQELQTFLSELYVYLIDQMHVALGKVLALEDQPPIPEPLTDSAQLKHFAREAEVNDNYELATKYYQERIARNKNDPSHWFDYGTFCLYINDITKAEECFKECIAIDQKHLHGLLLYGVVCTLQQRHEAAETFFEAATCVDPKSILAWTMLGLFYDAVNNEIGAEMAYLEANKLNQSKAVAIARASREEEQVKEREARGQEAEEKGEADGSHAGDQGGLAPPQQPHPDIKQPSPPGSDKPPTSARSGGQRSLSDRRQSATRRSGSHHKVGSQRGSPQPHEETEEQPPREPTPVPACSIYMHAIEWLLEVKAIPFTERALAHELLSPVGGPTSQYHIAFARLKLQKKETTDAEESLNEALQFDYQNPDAWALMGHVKYMIGDTENAKDCYERTISFLHDASEMHSIYLRLASIYLQDQRFQDAKNVFLMACKKSASCVSWLGVGIACYRLNELGEAEDALSEANILNNADPEVWAYLSLVCLKTGRQLEAEQAYKYAIKLNLQDTDLLNEIQSVQQQVGFGNPEF